MFNSRTPGQLVNELNRNREMSPGHVPLQELLGKNNGKSVAPNIDKETGLPVAGKYLNNGQEQNAARSFWNTSRRRTRRRTRKRIRTKELRPRHQLKKV